MFEQHFLLDELFLFFFVFFFNSDRTFLRVCDNVVSLSMGCSELAPSKFSLCGVRC